MDSPSDHPDNALRRLNGYQAFLLELALRFIHQAPEEGIDEAIEDGLARMSRFFEADRAYVFRYQWDNRSGSNTHEWCAPGVVPMKEHLQNLPMAPFQEWVDAHLRGEPFVIPAVDELPEGPLKALLEPQQISSLLTTPMMEGKHCLGFVGFDSQATWHHFGEEEREALALFANLLLSLQQRQAVAQALRDSEERYRLLFEQSQDAMMVVSPPDWRFEAGNPAMVELFGAQTLNELLSLSPVDLSPPSQPDGQPSAERAQELLQTALEKGSWFGEWMHRRRDGRDIPCTVLLTRHVIGGRTVVQGTVRDIGLQKAQQRQLERIAHYDTLTGLPSRVLLADRMQQAMAQTQRRGGVLAIAYIDLDGFKEVNDQYGHDTGDRMLVLTAERMRQTLRETDTLARLGGDEFVAVFTDLPGPDACLPLVQRLQEACTQQEHPMTASVGVTFYPQVTPMDADQLLRQADQAMYQAKLAGKNRLHLFDVAHDQAIRGQRAQQLRLEKALAAQEFVLHYQPKVHMRTGEVVGVEALVRWQPPDHPLVPPGDFLPLLEGHALELGLGHWVIETALAQLHAWRQAGLMLTVSVNVGAHQLQHPGFVASLREALERHPGLPADALELEILESSALQDLERVTQIIEDCLTLGVRFALDDFGTGYSSLTYLRRLPAQTLKIDRSFVRDMLDDPEDRAILEGVLGLARAFQRTPVAEGVETVAQGVHLLALGCELAQGFGIARPMPGTDVAAWMRDWRPPREWMAGT